MRLAVLFVLCGCGPVTVESPSLTKSMQDLGSKLDTTGSKYLVEQLNASQQQVRALEEANKELLVIRDKATAAATAPYELELECEAAAGSQSEITTSIDGVKASSIGCPSRSGRIALRQWTPKEGKLHVELHVGNDAAGYSSFNVRLWHGTENVWTVFRGNPMTKLDGCKQAADHRIECAFDDPFQVEPHKRVIDRQ